ncbi:hypothetical protein [Streptomyces sp. cmx-18-6]|uniref:hypothetical protein n=1 Tax=Streptomyces sp. cmx-18-6 TaxID=2790930 RepID=UPI00397F7110
MTQNPNGTENTGSTPNRPTPSTGAERVPPVTPPGTAPAAPVPPAAAKPSGSTPTSDGALGTSAPAADPAHTGTTRTPGSADTGRAATSPDARETGRTTASPDSRDTGRTGSAKTSSPGTDAGRSTGSVGDGNGRPLFATEEREKFDARIHQAVAGFVENPRQAVQEADATFDEVVAKLTEALSDRSRLLRADRDGERSEAGTEDLRIALQQYRDLTERLVRL